MLKHDVAGLVGANIEDIIIPSSHKAIQRLIRDLIIAERQAMSSSVDEGNGEKKVAGHARAPRGRARATTATKKTTVVGAPTRCRSTRPMGPPAAA